MKTILSFAFLLFTITFLSAQSNIQQSLSVNSSGTTANPSAQLDVSATDKGMLVPRMTTAQRTAIASPATGLLVFDTDTNTFWFSDNGFWTELSVAAPPEMGSNTTALPIPDCDLAGVTSIITLNQSGLVGAGSRFVVCLDITHPRTNNVNISLESPDGTAIVLTSNNGSGNSQNFTGTCFTTEAVNPITGGMGPFTGNWIPEEPFSNFIGDAIAGDWTLKVVDDKCNHVGQLNNWSIQVLRSSGTPSAITDADNDTRIQVEESPDEDIIRFDLGGTEKMVLRQNADGHARLEMLDAGSNLSVGQGAGADHTTGFSNTAIGTRSLFLNTDRSGLVAVGDSALYNNGTGATQAFQATGNTAIGSKALFSNTTGGGNTANGREALYSNTTGGANTANGREALYSNTTGFSNTANGRSALYSNTTGFSNTANGWEALFSNTTGSFNTANGYLALYSNTTGHYNTANGYQALYSNTTGSFNTANGRNALYFNTTGQYNTANGSNALLNNTTANFNTATGMEALVFNTTGDRNTAIGRDALFSNDTGNQRTALGYSANSFGGALDNSTGLGYDTDCTAANQVRIGNGVTSIGGPQNWTNTSDGRFKRDVQETVQGLDFILKLRPVTYHFDQHALEDFMFEHYGERDTSQYEWRYEIEKARRTGFIAQEVEQAAQSVGYDFSGVDAPKNEDDYYGLRYAEFVVPLVKGMQEQQEIIENGKLRMEHLEAENAAQSAEIERLKKVEAQLDNLSRELGKITAALAGAGIALEK